MRIAIPTEGSKIAEHFGRCSIYTIAEIEGKNVISNIQLRSPQHAPGIIPKFLRDNNVDIVITGGVGNSAIQLFESYEIGVITGVTGDIETIIKDFAMGVIKSGESLCNHEDEDHEHRHNNKH